MSKTLYVIDGYGIIYQSYFAFINRPLLNPMGQNSQAVFGFFRTFFEFVRTKKPGYCVVILDSKTPTFRHLEYAEYKAHREETPQELYDQIDVIESILEKLGVAMLRVNGFEADDLAATLAVACPKAGFRCTILSRDKDILQLVNEHVFVLRGKNQELAGEEWTRENVHDSIGIWPEQMTDYLALTGDQSDNIPGVKGVGPKTAVKLLCEFNTLEGIYENINSVKGAVHDKLLAGKENAFFSRRLATLDNAVPCECSPSSFRIKLDTRAAMPLFIQQGMKSVVQSLGGYTPPVANDAGSVPDDAAIPGNALSSTKPGTYEPVLTEEKLHRIIGEATGAGVFAFDTETNSLDNMQAELLGVSIALSPGKAWYIPVLSSGTKCLSLDLVLKALRPLLENPDLLLVGQNIKYDYKVLHQAGLSIRNRLFDTMVAAWLLDTETQSRYNLDDLAEKYLSHKTIHYEDVVEKGSLWNLSSVDLQAAADYAAEDADIAFRLYGHFLPLLESHGVMNVFSEIEMPCLRILSDMELAGIRVLPAKLQKLSGVFEKELGGLEARIYSAAGREFNINSPKQLGEILFEERKLPAIKKTKTGYSTDNSVLEQLALEEADEIPQMILDYRSLAKLKNTYLDTLPKLINRKTARIHTQYMQTGTATGRLSSKDPNLQNIPVKSENGRKIREAFVPEAGSLFISADYSQIELVVLAHLSKDPLLSRAFTEGLDIHRLTASIIFQTDLDSVTPEQRRMGKTVNFGTVYGMSAFRLARDFKISRREAEEFIEAYFTRYTGVASYRDQVITEAVKTGYVSTISGRTRKVAAIGSANRTERAGAERIAFNTVIQGSAADIVKIAMIKINDYLVENSLSTRLLLQVHDELILESPETEAPQIRTEVKRIMEKAVELSVPLRVNIDCGESWGSIH